MDLSRTYTFVFDPDPEGGFVVTCPSLPGLATHGESLVAARDMARDAMLGYIEVLLEDGERVPDDDPSMTLSGTKAGSLVEQLTASLVEAA